MTDHLEEIFLKKYLEYVDSITSNKSKKINDFFERVKELNNYFNVPRLLTSEIGLSGETGEFSDLIKKIIFHGKEFNDQVRNELIKELGDIMWYWANACMSLNLDPYEVIKENINKLRKRYPNGFIEERNRSNENNS